MKNLIRPFVPPIVYSLKKLLSGKLNKNNQLTWEATYKSWKEVSQCSSGYGFAGILEKVRSSALMVKNRQVAFERDGVPFKEMVYNFPVTACIQYIYQNHKHLDIVDFGGSLGTTYFQNRVFTEPMQAMSWSIIEQKAFVEIGKSEFADDRLRFYHSFDEVNAANPRINCLLFSNSLQYLEDPWAVLDQSFKHKYEYILFDRVAFTQANDSLLSIQHVPETIYKATYPCWLFNEAAFLNKLDEKYDLKFGLYNSDISIPIKGHHAPLYWKGGLFKLKK